jgi:hypothetical protein
MSIDVVALKEKLIHTILSRVGGTVYNDQTLEPLNKLGLDS